MKQTERYYKEEFKRQIVELYQSGKSVTELNNEYKISRMSIRKWIKQIETSGKFGKIMKKYKLISNWTLRRAKPKACKLNNDKIANKINCGFGNRGRYEVVVSDLTYVKIGGQWRYICLLLDLCGRKIIGSAVGNQKNANLVETAFYSVQADLSKINIFHTDRGSEFKNEVIEQIMEFADLAQFKLLLFDYVNWYNNIRIHGSLDYLTPSQ